MRIRIKQAEEERDKALDEVRATPSMAPMYRSLFSSRSATALRFYGVPFMLNRVPIGGSTSDNRGYR